MLGLFPNGVETLPQALLATGRGPDIVANLGRARDRPACRHAQRQGGAVGIDVTIFNPKLDADASIASTLVATLVRGLDASSGST